MTITIRKRFYFAFISMVTARLATIGLALISLITIGLVTISLVTATAYANDTIVLGVNPTRGPVEMEHTFGRLARIINEVTPQTVVFRTRNGNDEFVAAFNNNEFDIAIIHPFDFFRSPARDNYLPLVRIAGDLQAVFVVSNKDIHSLEQLHGKTIAFPRSKGFVLELGLRRLMASGLNAGDYGEVFNHNFTSSIQSLINTNADACLTLRKAMRDYMRQNNVELQVIAETEAIPPPIFVVNKKLITQIEPIREHLLALNNSEQGRITLNFLLFDELQTLDASGLAAMQQNSFYKDLISRSAAATFENAQVP